MAERAHEPKLAALAALHEGRLSPRGRARLQRHLARCPICSAAWTGTGRYAALRVQARDADMPELDWERIERAALDQVRGARARVRLLRGLAMGGALAAAAVLLLLTRPQPSVPEPAPSARVAPKPVPSTPAPETLAVHIGVLAGEARTSRESEQAGALGIDSVLREGASVETGPNSEAHLWLDATAALLLAPDSRITLLRLREREIEIALDRGEVISSVRPLGGGRYAVQASGHRVVVRGTLFSVARAADDLSVQVDTGAVAILRADEVVAELRAPQRWSSADEPERKMDALRRPHPMADGAAGWPVLEVPTWPRIVRWEIGGTALPAAQSLRMRVPVGELEVGALLADGRRMVARITVDPVGARFDPRELRFTDVQPRAQAATPDLAAVAAVIRAGQPGLQRCYERSLRNQPAGALRARLELELDGHGAVRRARLRSEAAVPDLLRDCVRNVAAAWRFPSTGGSGITFEAPILFQPR